MYINCPGNNNIIISLAARTKSKPKKPLRKEILEKEEDDEERLPWLNVENNH